MSRQTEREQSQQDPSNNEASNAGESFHDEEAIAQAERELRMAQQGGEDPLEGLAERAKENPDCVFDRRVLEAAVLQSEGEQAAHASLRRALKASGIALGPFDAAVKKMAREMNERVEREQEERSRELAEQQRAARIEQEAREREEREQERRAAIEAAPWKEQHYAIADREGTTYEMEPGCIRVQLPPSKNDEGRILEAGFSARILLERVEHDGNGPTRTFHIEASATPNGPPLLLKVDSEEWEKGTWITRHIGGVFVSPERGARERIRAGITLLSQPVSEERVYGTIGFIDVAGERVFLHAGGAIGRNGFVDGVKATVLSDLADFTLPLPLEGDELRAGILASLELVDLQTAVTVPVFAGVWRAPLGSTRTTVYLGGKPQSGKSALAGLAQAHVGANWNGEHFPADWNSSTANGIALAMAQVGDALFVVDDLKLSGTAKDDEVYRKADTVIRFQHNRSIPRRMSRDVRARTGMASRCLLLATGEVLPRGESLRSRMIVVELHERLKADLGPHIRRAAEGTYAATMAAFVRWLAGKPMNTKELESAAQARLGAGPDRTVKMLASLLVGLDALLSFALEVGALDAVECEAKRARWEQVLRETLAAQGVVVAQEDPALRFRELVLEALRSGDAHVLSTAKDNPAPTEDPSAWGWKPDAEKRWSPSGKRIGFLDQNYPSMLWLLRHAAHAVVCELARRNGNPFALPAADLPKRLHAAGMLSKHCDAYRRAKSTAMGRKKIGGQEYAVLDLVLVPNPSTSTESDDLTPSGFLAEVRSRGAMLSVRDGAFVVEAATPALTEEIRLTAESFGDELVSLIEADG